MNRLELVRQENKPNLKIESSLLMSLNLALVRYNNPKLSTQISTRLVYYHRPTHFSGYSTLDFEFINP
jgi:hypothetical protein